MKRRTREGIAHAKSQLGPVHVGHLLPEAAAAIVRAAGQQEQAATDEDLFKAVALLVRYLESED